MAAFGHQTELGDLRLQQQARASQQRPIGAMRAAPHQFENSRVAAASAPGAARAGYRQDLAMQGKGFVDTAQEQKQAYDNIVSTLHPLCTHVAKWAYPCCINVAFMLP